MDEEIDELLEKIEDGQQASEIKRLLGGRFEKVRHNYLLKFEDCASELGALLQWQARFKALRDLERSLVVQMFEGRTAQQEIYGVE